jgi:hypothetical protein
VRRATDELDNSVHEWRLVYSEKNRGHALWSDDADGGRLALADNSAVLPHDCVDRVLWVDRDRHPRLTGNCIFLPAIQDKSGMKVSIPTTMSLALACGFLDFLVKTDTRRHVVLTVKEVLDEKD